ncbi:Replication factor C C-terminal [Trinorchestia longiramus]|nr:Replication factor C C-terminal [Trinorchestia longiramus]
MTHSAQAALRRTMEKSSRSTRFCLICNYVSRIIEPLTSRCTKFRFRPLGVAILEERLRSICTAEDVSISEAGVAALIEVSDGDLRRAITALQSVARLQGGKEIQEEHVYDITGAIPQTWLQGLIDACVSGSYDKLSSYVDDFMAEGYAAAQLLLQMNDVIVAYDNLSDVQKAAVCEKIAVCDHRLMEGGDEYLQIMDLSCCLMHHLTKANA